MPHSALSLLQRCFAHWSHDFGAQEVSLLNPEPPTSLLSCTQENFDGSALVLSLNSHVLEHPGSWSGHETSPVYLDWEEFWFPDTLLSCQLGLSQGLASIASFHGRTPTSLAVVKASGEMVHPAMIPTSRQCHDLVCSSVVRHSCTCWT